MNLLAFLSDRCNMSCSYCFLKLNAGRAVLLDLEDLKRAIDAHRAAHPRGRVTLLGGEPALHWEQLRGAAAHAGAPVTVATNGTLLAPERLSELRALGAEVCVSLDGDAAANDAFRRLLSGGSALEAALRRLEGADKAALRVNLVLSPSTAPRLVRSLEFLRGAGFRRFSFHPDVMGAWDAEATVALRVALEGARRWAAALGPRVEVSHAAAYARACGEADEVVLGADGNYYPCDGLFSRPYAELRDFRCGCARSGLDDAARARWNRRARQDIHGLIGDAHWTCPREPYFRALAEGADWRAACRGYAAADAALGEALRASGAAA